MFWLIETNSQLKELSNKGYTKAFVEVIPNSYVEHPCLNDVCAVYIRPLDAAKGFIIPISHSETLSISIDNVNDILNEFNSVYVRDKKEFLHYFLLKNTFDITLHSPTYIRELTQCHHFFHKHHSSKKDVSRIIPIVKHYELCEDTFNELKPNINEEQNNFYNTKAPMVFNALERSGIRVDKQEFESHFHGIDGEYAYTQFNFKTLTRRPSNKFKGVNYAALNKKNDERKSFIPRNDLFIELDISAYHPTLLAKLIGYTFDSGDIHEAFAEMYGVDYQKAKEITFKQLYGGIWDEYKDLEFFRRAQVYIDELWEKFNNEGFIEVPISGWIYRKDELEDMNPQKLLNYLLQGLETAMNIRILWDMLKLLRGKNTKIVLYTYDSFLFDLDKAEKETYKQILQIFRNYELKTKTSYGNNYKF